MITCQHARQLFDRHLDGELSPSLQAELHAHQLSCSACQSELAMLEACGDVIMLDRRREPTLSESFTDRVLMARRSQLASQPRKRNWGRALVVFGSPLAAAASIALALTLMWPSAPQRQRPNMVAFGGAKVSTVVSNTLGAAPADVNLDRNLHISQMPASSFMESLLASIVERTSQTAEGTRNNLSQLELLLQQALADTNAQLAVQEDASPRRMSSPDGTSDRLNGDQDQFSPLSPNSDANGESGSDLLLDPL